MLSVIDVFNITVGAVIVIVVKERINGRLAGDDRFPAASVKVTFRLYSHSHGNVIILDHPPVILTIPVPKTTPDAFLIVNIVFGSPVHIITGLLFPQYDHDVGAIMVGAIGTIVSFVNIGSGI